MSARFRLDSRGHLVAEDTGGHAAQAELGSRPGSFVWLPTTPDLLALVRSPPLGISRTLPRTVLVGDASGFPLSDLIAFLGQNRWTGVIRVYAPSGERALALQEGEIRSATSDDPADRLGECLVRLGFVSRDQVEEILGEHPPSKLGRALVEKGALQAHELWKCINHQVSEIFYSIMLCRDGTFTLTEQALEERAAQNVQLSMHGLLMDSIRKVDEMAHFRKRIAHGRVYVGRKRPSDGKLEELEDRVLSLATGEKTVVELGQATKLSEFDVTKVIYRLLEGGYASVAERPISLGSQAAGARGGTLERPAELHGSRTEDARRVIATFNTIFKEIQSELAAKGMAREFVGAANTALETRALSTSPVLADLRFDEAGSFSEELILAAFEGTRSQLGSEPIASLTQALSDVMFFLLFQAGELLETQRDEALARRVKELLQTLEET